jgi:hypothetical protein
MATAKGQVWKHLKSGGIYSIVGHCQLEATNRPAVLYASVSGDGRTWARDEEEFMDGRFIKLDILGLNILQ